MTTYTHPDDATTTDGLVLWDSTPGVCCAAFQLGACAHTEADADEYEAAYYATPEGIALLAELEAAPILARQAAVAELDPEPF